MLFISEVAPTNLQAFGALEQAVRLDANQVEHARGLLRPLSGSLDRCYSSSARRHAPGLTPTVRLKIRVR
jgi:hypothetical protein